MAGTDLATRPNGTAVSAAVAPALDDDLRLAEMMAKSGYFRDVKDVAQAIVKIQYGREMGIGPAQAMSGVYIVEGKPTLGAGVIASRIQNSGRYDYRVKQLDDSGCVLDFYERGKLIGTSSFTKQDAIAAELWDRPTWKKYRRNMLFSRALTNGARWYCASVFGGAVYTPDELQGGGADVIEATIIERPAQAPTPAAARTIDLDSGEIVTATLEPEQDEPAEAAPDEQRPASRKPPTGNAAFASRPANKWTAGDVRDYYAWAVRWATAWEIDVPALPDNATAQQWLQAARDLVRACNEREQD